MYNQFFDFKERPFKLVPNPEYLYLSRIHEEVLAYLNYAVDYGEGFVAITGEVGTGKTTLCRMFLENLNKNTEAAYIFNPKLDVLQLLKSINDEFGLPSTDSESVKVLIDRLNAFLLDMKARGRRVLLLVDEAQNLSVDVLEQLRLLSNLETTTSKLLQIILVGQPELGVLLESDTLRQLNQRITLSCHLIPLTLEETREYIRHRIHVASRKPGLAFSAPAYRSIFKYSGGVPRLINIACDRALLTAFTRGKHGINNNIVKQALHELNGERKRKSAGARFRNRGIVAVLSILVIAAAGLYIGRSARQRPNRRSLEPIVRHKIESPALNAAPAISVEKASAQLPQPVDSQPAPKPPVSGPSVAAEVAAGAPAPNAAAADRSPPAETFDQAIDSADPLNSRLGALKAVLKQWKILSPATPLETESAAVADNDTFFRIAALHNGLQSLRVKGNLNLIRKLNLPAILEFPLAGGGAPRFMAVVGLSGDQFQLSDGNGIYTVPATSLAGLWNGVAHVFWKNFFNYKGVIPTTSSGEAIISLKIHLKALGYAIPEMNAAYDTDTRMAVEEIQARNGLKADGKVGPLTKIALYNEDKSLTIPRLVAVSKGG